MYPFVSTFALFEFNLVTLNTYREVKHSFLRFSSRSKNLGHSDWLELTIVSLFEIFDVV